MTSIYRQKINTIHKYYRVIGVSLATWKQEIGVGIYKKQKQIRIEPLVSVWTAAGRPAGHLAR